MKIKSTVLLPAITAVLTANAVPALADKPVPFPRAPAVFTNVDPCTGALQEFTINFDILLHSHQNMWNANIRRTGSTDAGYELVNGVGKVLETFQGGLFFNRLVDIWRSDDGRVFQVTSQILIDTTADPSENVKMAYGLYRCISGETIIP